MPFFPTPPAAWTFASYTCRSHLYNVRPQADLVSQGRPQGLLGIKRVWVPGVLGSNSTPTVGSQCELSFSVCKTASYRPRRADVRWSWMILASAEHALRRQRGGFLRNATRGLLPKTLAYFPIAWVCVILKNYVLRRMLGCTFINMVVGRRRVSVVQ